ncbi:DUF4177 domain-containing protein [Clostridium tyrobutyricum]|uniref:DUF4177 domain-containing protein n=1 Tax=Clostridium tyrobutyricum TaxID=1519 RepID=UPI001C3CE214|nr:DUF4177 domain-containing protein [Clostridium tyrobutyricum]MBV4436853.1 DUF4177 domain-containing protein [Clostridium tyrobutyricum]
MKWEYKVFTLEHFYSLNKGLDVEETLNNYGKNGWELVGVLQKHNPTLGVSCKLDSDSIVFKRQVGQ